MSKSVFSLLVEADVDEDYDPAVATSKKKVEAAEKAAKAEAKVAAARAQKEDLAALAFGTGNSRKKKGKPTTVADAFTASSGSSRKGAPPTAAPPTAATADVVAAPKQDEAVRRYREEQAEKEFEENLAQALRQSLVAGPLEAPQPPTSEKSSTAVSTSKGKSKTGKRAHVSNTSGPVLKDADDIDKAVATELRFAKFRDEMAADRLAASSRADVSCSPAAQESILSRAPPPGLGQVTAMPASAFLASVPAHEPVALPTLADAMVAKPEQLLQMYALQTYEITRLKELTARQQVQLHEARSRLDDVSVKEKTDLLAATKQLKMTVSEFGTEIARLHMEEQRHLSRIRELEAITAHLQAQLKGKH